MYARKIGDKTLTFDFAMGLNKDNLLFVDRETHSIWSQLDSKAISGAMKNTPLQIVPSLQTTWEHWRERHPGTMVMVRSDNEGRPYIYRDRQPGMPRPKERPKEHNIAQLGLGLVVNEKAIYFPLSKLYKEASPVQIEVAGQKLSIFHRKKAFTAWAEDDQGEMLPGVLVYKNGWLGFFPQSEIYDVSHSAK